MSSQLQSHPLAIAILLNSYKSPHIHTIRDSYTRTLHSVDPTLSLTFFYPADHPFTPLPDPSLFDLIIIGGGNADPRKTHPWILRVHAFILETIATYPLKKMVGICWGHQTISLLFGAEIVDMATPELGVTESKVTAVGQRLFARETVRLQQHHRRAVGGIHPRGFAEVVAGGEGFLSWNGAVLTLQGHPEKDARAARVRIGDAARWFGMDMGDDKAVGEVLRQMEGQHDGAEVWRGILRWVREGAGSGPGLGRRERI